MTQTVKSSRVCTVVVEAIGHDAATVTVATASDAASDAAQVVVGRGSRS